ncbi:hypothetical protein [Kribbella albertanoniae]|uniref:Helix-turn-helix domain-containing protein n=1 Tax=Kribbella albertanoniae TaxID=1266829 RepID=A0A4R4QI88_9ACTN|nr:hypothetical protein [Kribbella albertanoniae]TDC34983.1 hypothetical protein E1261_02035 [Kribbella albertanoniae]
MERHDERIAATELLCQSEIARLTKACGSAEAAAEILGVSQREVRRVVKAERTRLMNRSPRTELRDDDV